MLWEVHVPRGARREGRHHEHRSRPDRLPRRPARKGCRGTVGKSSSDRSRPLDRGAFGALPSWVNEGLAEFFSNFLPHERGATIGRPIQWHVARLRQGMIPLDELLGLSGESPEYSGGERTGLIYAQSWALVHALVFDPAGSDRLGVLLRRLAAGVPSGNAIRDVYGPSAPDSLLRQLRVDVE